MEKVLLLNKLLFYLNFSFLDLNILFLYKYVVRVYDVV